MLENDTNESAEKCQMTRVFKTKTHMRIKTNCIEEKNIFLLFLDDACMHHRGTAKFEVIVSCMTESGCLFKRLD